MKTFKKLAALLLALAMVISMVACGGNEEKETSTKASEATKATEGTKATEATKAEEAEAFTLEIYTTYDSQNGIDPNNLYWFRYAEARLREQGFNVTIAVSGATGEEATQGKALRLSTNTLPDIMFGFALTGQDTVLYGDSDGMLLDLTPYLNEEYMPNAYACANSAVGADGFAASYTPAGKIYGVPYIVDRTLGWNAGTRPNFNEFSVNTEMLEELGLEMPTTVDEWLDALRAVKGMTAEDGTAIMPLLASNGTTRLISTLTACAGYYGYRQNAINNYGMQVAIKDEKIAIPVYTQDFKKVLETAATMYKEGLIPAEYYTIDGDTKSALAHAENYLMLDEPCTSIGTEVEQFLKYLDLGPTKYDDDTLIAASANTPYKCNRVWASATTKYPEAVVAFMDLLYEDDSMAIYWYGPIVEDKLGIYDNVWVVEGDQLVNPKIADGTFVNFNAHQFDMVSPVGQIGKCDTYDQSAYAMAGLTKTKDTVDYIDVVTGETVTVTNKSGYIEKYETENDAHARLNIFYAWQNNLTIVEPEMLYVDELQAQRIVDLTSVLNAYAEEQVAQFVTGGRSLDTYDKFLDELKGLGIEELLGIYEEGYAPYIESVFGK